MKILREKLHREKGFTLAELVVSVSIFATTITIMMVLLNYTLKIQRKTEALRQASQGMRNFVEFIVKEIRNGKIDYGVSGGVSLQATQGPCPNPGSVGLNTYGQTTYFPSGGEQGQADTRLGIINLNNEKECIFWAKDISGTLTAASSTDITNGLAQHLAISKNTYTGGYERLNPPNMTIDYLRFYIRPLCDPYTTTCPNGGLPERQPFVTLIMRFRVKVDPQTEVMIPYQTTITTDDYAIPRT